MAPKKSNMTKHCISWLSACLLLVTATAQTVLPDTSSPGTLTVAQFMEAVKQHHPVARQAALIPKQALAQLQIARGGFDPLIYSNYDNKVSDGVNYYSYFENSVKLPAWYGIEVKAGYDVVYGNYINPESKLPNDGLGYVGISVPLLKNMLMDKRRAALRQAQIFREQSVQQQLMVLNDLMYEALKAYYEWWYADAARQILRNAVLLADIRFDATVKSAELGDRPAIDTVEALTQLQSRQLQLFEAELSYLQAGLEVSNFLWAENDLPVVMDTAVHPAMPEIELIRQPIDYKNLEALITRVNQQHPAIIDYRLKLRQLDIERRLKLENLKPVLNANYNVISSRFSFPGSATDVLGNNYKLGVQFYMPLTFAQGRGELKLARLKIQDTRYELDLKTLQLNNKLKAVFNELATLQQQNSLYEQSVENFRRLFAGEVQRFNTGESSLFLVNARENRYIEVQIKLAELQAKYFKTEAALKWAAASF